MPIQLTVFATATRRGRARPAATVGSDPSLDPRLRAAAHAGKTAQVTHEIRRDSGRVRIDGEEWTARTYDEALVIPVDTMVDVLEIKGVIALVYPRE